MAKTVAACFFVLALIALFVTAGIAVVVNSPGFYFNAFMKYDVGNATGLAPSELQKVADGFVSYYNSNEPSLNITVIKDGKPFALFNQREIVHMQDVKGLVWLDYRVLAIALTYVAGFTAFALLRRQRRMLGRYALAGSAFTLGIMLLFGIGMLFDFDALLLQFHLISFSNDFWQLNPATDYLIRLIPEGLLYDGAAFVGLAIAGMAVVVGGASLAYLRLTRRAELLREGNW